MTRNRAYTLAGLTLLGAAGCSEGKLPFGMSSEAVVPNGYNGMFVSANLPSTMVPNEKLNTLVTMNNNGTVAWTAGAVYLYDQDNPQIFPATSLPITVQPGQNATFAFDQFAPATTGSFNQQMQLYLSGTDGFGFFGQFVSRGPINVANGNTPRWRCSFVSSTVPPTMSPGQQSNVSITVRNTGSGTWVGNSSLCLYDSNSNQGQFGAGTICLPLTAQVVTNGTTTFSFPIQAPNTAGTYNMIYNIFDQNPPNATNGVGVFGLGPCVNIPVQVQGAAADDASVVSQNFPTTMRTGETRQITLTMQNNGTDVWTPGSFGLESGNSPYNLWGPGNEPITSNVAMGGQFTFSFNITAPSTAGNYMHVWRMYKYASPGTGYFGTGINIPVTVSANAQAQYDATVVSQTIPNPINRGSQATFTIVMQNTGSSSWTQAQGFQLLDVGNPQGTWGTTAVNLNPGETVASGQQRTFTFTVTAPTTPGTYSSNWRMNWPGTGQFGQTATTNGINVTACGNRITEPQFGETCDDGNLVSGDGCSSSCQIEPQSVDLETQTITTFVGTQGGAQAGNVAVGDVNGDGIPDLIVAEYGANWLAADGSARPGAGTVHIYSGATSFFTNMVTTMPTGEMAELRGAASYDSLGGGYNGSVVVADVTNDGVPDIIVGGLNAGPNNRSNAGTVYVIQGSSALTTAGNVDMASPPANLLYMTIYGPSSGAAIRVLAANGDVNGDGINDILIGMPGDATNGSQSGGAAVVLGGGGPGLVIDLANPNSRVLTMIHGNAVNERLGYTSGALGDINGDGLADIALGTGNSNPGGRMNAGAVWAFFTPINQSSYSIQGGQFSAQFFGAHAFDQMGISVQIGQVRGSATPDLVIGASQGRNISNQLVGTIDVWTGPLTAGTYDLGGGSPPTPGTRILGRTAPYLLGSSIALGDMNADGFLDIAASAPAGPGPNNNVSNLGEVTVIIGAQNMAGTIDLSGIPSPSFRLYGHAQQDQLAPWEFNLAIGDLDHDGRPDLVIGDVYGNLSGGAPGFAVAHRTPW